MIYYETLLITYIRTYLHHTCPISTYVYVHVHIIHRSVLFVRMILLYDSAASASFTISLLLFTRIPS
jgi:hypothetical protein